MAHAESNRHHAHSVQSRHRGAFFGATVGTYRSRLAMGLAALDKYKGGRRHNLSIVTIYNACCRSDASVDRMTRNAVGLRKLEEEGWLSWHSQAVRDAQPWVVSKLGCTYSDWFLRQTDKKWEPGLARHELTHIRRIVGWQNAALGVALAAVPRMRGNAWRRRRIGRSPKRWEAPRTFSGGIDWVGHSTQG